MLSLFRNSQTKSTEDNGHARRHAWQDENTRCVGGYDGGCEISVGKWTWKENEISLSVCLHEESNLLKIINKPTHTTKESVSPNMNETMDPTTDGERPPSPRSPNPLERPLADSGSTAGQRRDSTGSTEGGLAVPRRASSTGLPATSGSAGSSDFSRDIICSTETPPASSATASPSFGDFSGCQIFETPSRRGSSASAMGSPAQPGQNSEDELHPEKEIFSSHSQGDGDEDIMDGDLAESPASHSGSGTWLEVRDKLIHGDGDGDGNDDTYSDSDGDDRQNNEAHGTEEEPPLLPSQNASAMSHLSSIHEEDSDESQLTLGTGARDTLEIAQQERKTMFDPLLQVIQDGEPDMPKETFQFLRADAHDPPVWRPVDVKSCVEGYIEMLQQELERPAGGTAPAPREMCDRVAAQMRNMAAKIEGLVNEAVARYVERDAHFVRDNIKNLAWVLEKMLSSAQKGDAFTKSPEPTPNSGRQSRMTMLSNSSGPESVHREFEPRKLLKLPLETLVDIIMSQQEIQKEWEQDRDREMEWNDDKIQSLITREEELKQEKKGAAKEIRELKARVRTAHENGLHGLNIDGTDVATPERDGGRGRGRQESDHERGRYGGPDSPVSTKGEEDVYDTPVAPSRRRRGADGPAGLDASPPYVPVDDMRQELDDVQALMVAAEEEDIMRRVSRPRHEAPWAMMKEELASAAAAAFEAAPSTEAPASNRTSTTGSDGATREQLQTQLRMAEAELAALRAGRDQDDAGEVPSRDERIDNLTPSERQRVADVSELSMKFISGFLPQFTRCGRTASNFAQTMINVGRINRGRGSDQVQEALQIIIANGVKITESEPRTYDQAHGDEYGQFEQVEKFQEEWLPELQIFFSHFIKLFNDLDVLRARILAWDRENPRNDLGQMVADLPSEGSRQRSTSGGSILSRAASGISNWVFGDEQEGPSEKPMYTIPEWARLHPDDGPCPDCLPVMRFCDMFQWERGLGAREREQGAILEPRSAMTRSRRSGSSRVSFADSYGPLASARSAPSPKSTRSTRSIMRRRSREGMRLDVELANTDAWSDLSTQTGSRHRPSDASSRRQHQGRLSQGSGLGRVAPATDDPASHGRLCLCRTGELQNILTAGNGTRFAFYYCTRMTGDRDLEPSENSASREETELFVETAVGIGAENPATPLRSGSSRPTALSSASSASQMAAAFQASRAPSGASGSALPSGRPTQDVAQPPTRGFETPPGVPAVLTRRHSGLPPQRPRRAPPPTPTLSDGGLARPAGLDQWGENALEPIQDRGAREQGDEGDREDNENAVDSPRAASRNDQHQDEQHGELQDEPQVTEIQPAGGQVDDGVIGPQRPQAPEPELEPELPNPRGQIIWLIRTMIRFFTWGQVYNMWIILQYLSGLAYYAGRRNVDRFRRLRGQPALRAWAPVLPTSELFEVVLWVMLVWFSVLMIAISEERRLWLAANPRTASYMRGLRHREPYPWWSPFEVDYALLEPGIVRLSVWLHRAVFRPGLEAMLGLEENQLVEAVGNATWLAWAGVPLVAVM